MKKLLLTLLGALLALPAFAYDFEVDGIYYNITGNSTCSVTYKDSNFNSCPENIVIPSSVTYNGTSYSVTEIGEMAFINCKGLTSVTIPNSVTKIGYFSFGNCSGLTSVVIPNSVTSIGNAAFQSCSGLTSVTIPNSVTYIGNAAFAGCSGLTSVTIPNSVTSIGEREFSNCSGLTSVTIPNSVTSIGESAFYYCKGLTSIEIPNSVTEIGRYAFQTCRNLTSITIGNLVTKIGFAAFEECTKLVEFNVTLNNNTYTSYKGVLYSKDLTKLILYPIGKDQQDFQIFNTITEICDGAFLGCKNIKHITIPPSIKIFGAYAFCGCSGLTSVTIPNSVTSIGSFAFSGCSGLTSITIPSSVTSIGERAFETNNLTSVTYLAEDPVTGTQDVFSSKVYEKATLNYLSSSELKIGTTLPWSLFVNSVGRDADFVDDSSISEVENSSAEAAAVYDMRGVKVGESTEGLSKGIYIVREGSTTRKIAI